MIKLLIFDLDGTLIDSAGDIIATVNGVLFERGLPPLPNETIRAAIGEGPQSLLKELFPESLDDPSFLAALEADFVRLYDHHLLKTTTIYPGVTDFLGSTNLHIALVTNKTEKFTRPTLKRLLLDRFPWVKTLSGDSLPEKKPSALPLFECMRSAGVTAHETIMIGDGIPDMGAARNAGVRAVACDYGYTDPLILRELGATASIQAFSELPSVLRRLES